MKRSKAEGASTGALRAFASAVAIVSWPFMAQAQAEANPPSPPPAPSAAESTPPTQSQPTRETLSEIHLHHQNLARLLDPREYGPAFGIGAQADFLAPTAGVSSVVAGYDAVFMQVDASVGFGIGGDPLTGKDAASTYAFDVRVGVPIHRGVRADFSILAGGGATLVEPPAAGGYVLGLGLAGGRIRVFESPNVALAATLGVAGIFRGDHSLFVLGAKPLGSASIVYFFR